MRNEYLVDKLVKLNVTKCPYFEYSNNPDYWQDLTEEEKQQVKGILE